MDASKPRPKSRFGDYLAAALNTHPRGGSRPGGAACVSSPRGPPTLSVPELSVPEVSVPKVSVLTFIVPKAIVPKVNVPKVSAPKVSVPTVRDPKVPSATRYTVQL